MEWIVYPYKIGSESAKRLAEALQIKRTKLPFRRHVINWGSTEQINTSGTILNTPESVHLAVSKLRTFTRLKAFNVSIPEYTLDKSVAKSWVDNGEIVYCRSVLEGTQGAGIFVVSKKLNNTIWLDKGKLFTKRVAPSIEYRVHVVRSKVIDITQKKRSGEVKDIYIRNHGNGWVFCRQDISIPRSIITTSIKAIKVLGLDFGSVDILFSGGTSYVLEVNTASGIEGTTIEKYRQAFKKIMEGSHDR